jgi:hypothetical protein
MTTAQPWPPRSLAAAQPWPPLSRGSLAAAQPPRSLADAQQLER